VRGTLDELTAARRAAREDALRAEGFAAATQGAVQALERAALAMEEQVAELQGQVAELASRIALDVAQELLRKELREGNYDIEAIVRSVLAQTGPGGAKTLRVHPEDAAALEGAAFRTGTTVVADPAVRRADVHLETDQGVLVRDIDACVATIRENLLEALGR
jgi:flagellar assembly protein FliH